MAHSPDGPHARPSVVLEVEDLKTEFRLRHGSVRAVDGVSLSVAEGESIGLVGESGCGKSTTGLSIMKLLPGVGHVTGGSVRLLGRDLLRLDEAAMQSVRGNDVAMIFQDPMTSLNPTRTIGSQIAEAVRLHRRVSRSEARGRALEVLGLVGMPRPAERLKQYPHQLSGGLRQRVMIAIALACEPKLLIADEPTTALDVTIQAQILDLIDDLRRRLKMAVILISHDLGVIAARSERVMVMYAGRIIEQAPTAELFAAMHHPYTEALFQSIPRLDQDRSIPLYSIPGLPPDLSRPIEHCRFAARCRYATDRCRSEDPPLGPWSAGAADQARSAVAALDSPEHAFACFHPVNAGAPPTPVVAPAETPARAAVRPVAALAPAVDQLLLVEHLVKEYAVSSGGLFSRRHGTVKAVSDVSFEVREGETFGLVGESGSGKTTIGRLVVALEEPDSGVVRFAGSDVASWRRAQLRRERRDIQLMFQDPYSSLDPRKRVGSTIAEPLVVQGAGTAGERRRRVEELLAEVGLPPSAAQVYPHELSGGQRQRVGLARALALSPRLIVADEPVSALDVSVQAQILNLMRTLQERHKLTYVVISHDLAVVRYLAETIGVMYLGKLVEVGPAEEVISYPAHHYTKGLIESVPHAYGARARTVGFSGELPSPVDPPSGCRFRTRCPRAEERCAREEPLLRPFGPGHVAACHFPLVGPSAREVLEVAHPA